MSKPVHLGLLKLELSKILMYGFCMIMKNQNMVKKKNFVIWIQILLYGYK